jgi:hypothetical protein
MTALYIIAGLTLTLCTALAYACCVAAGNEADEAEADYDPRIADEVRRIQSELDRLMAAEGFRPIHTGRDN